MSSLTHTSPLEGFLNLVEPGSGGLNCVVARRVHADLLAALQATRIAPEDANVVVIVPIADQIGNLDPLMILSCIDRIRENRADQMVFLWLQGIRNLRPEDADDLLKRRKQLRENAGELCFLRTEAPVGSTLAKSRFWENAKLFQGVNDALHHVRSS